MASRGNDSDGGGSLTPSEQSEGEERSEHDSDYETDDGKQEEDDSRDKNLNIIWTGYAKRIPMILFNVSSILHKHADLKTVGERYHMTFKFGGAECKIIRNILVAHGFHEVHPNSLDYNLAWTNSHLKPFTLRSLTEFQKINHFPRSSELTRKDRLYKNIQRMQQIKGVKHFDFVPQTFVMPGEYQEFCSQFLKDRGPWIVKPVASSRGRGVFLVNHPDQVPFDENVIVSHYLHNPLVIDGFKFDVRLYVAVTSYDPLVIYLYEEGLTRFATVKYEKSTKHLRNQCMHLTNYSVNKKSNDYVKNDDPDVEDYGNKWSMGAMLRYLRSMGRDTGALMMRIEDVVIKTLLSVELSIATACKMFMPYKGNCFELYGFDILVDDSLKPWVLEVNLSPSLACDSPLDLKIKGNMLCDLLSLTGIVCHDPMVKSLQQQSRRSQDLVARMTTRAKSACTRPGYAMPKARPQSATCSGKPHTGKTVMTGLNSEEIKIVRRIREEEQRKGGWVRIFPGPDTWDVHGPFLQFNTTHNLMIHQRLYPERHKQMGYKSPAGSMSSAATRSRNGYLQVTGTGQRLDTDKSIESYNLAMARSRQYERKLGTRSRRRRRDARQKDSRGRLVQGMPDDMDEGENQSDEEFEAATDGRGRPTEAEDKKTGRADIKASAPLLTEPNQVPQRQTKPIETRVQEVRVEATHPLPPAVTQLLPPPSPSPSPPSPPPQPKFNVVDLLMKGGMLSKVQARSAFAMYLMRVQKRLVSESGPLPQGDVDALNEQMDLVLRFLKRAAVNLQQTFRVVMPSRKLPLGDRRRILAKQLADFVHIYSRETEQLKYQLKVAEKTGAQNQATQSTELENILDETQFSQFISTASESELEQVLTTYTKLNKSASIFLGSSSATPSTSTTPSSPAKPPHTPLPPPQAQRFEMMQRRREAGEGDSKGSVGSVQVLREHSISSVDSQATGSAGSLSRPASSASGSTHTSGVSIYSQRLGRPLSATDYKPPAMKLTSRPSSAKPSPFSTSEPVVDTYNEQAIREALQRLAVKQQSRQYAAGNSSIAIKTDRQSASRRGGGDTYRRGSLPHTEDQTEHITTHPGTLQPPCSRPGSGVQRQNGQTEHAASLRTPSSQPRSRAQSLDQDNSTEYIPIHHGSHRSLNSGPGSGEKPEDKEGPVQYVTITPDSLRPSTSRPGSGSRVVQEGPNDYVIFSQDSPQSSHSQQVTMKSSIGKPPMPLRENFGGKSQANASAGEKVSQNQADVFGKRTSTIPSSKSPSTSVSSRPSQSQSYNQRPRCHSSDLDSEPSSRSTQLSQSSSFSQSLRSVEQRHQSSMEANKAKHHAMVAQAHAAQRSSTSVRSFRDTTNHLTSITEMEGSIARGAPTFTPKPPMHPITSRTKQSAPHRLARLPPSENVPLSFHSSLNYDTHTHQLRRKAETNTGH